MNPNHRSRTAGNILFCLSVACLAGLLPGTAVSQPVPVVATEGKHHAPPPAPPIVVIPAAEARKQNPPPEGLTPYSIGNPTDEEQLYLQYVNQARANPPAEGVLLATTTDPNVLSQYEYWGVDTNQLELQFDAITNSPPLAFNEELIAAARWHSGDMFTNVYEGHVQTNANGTTLDPGQRINAEGYSYYTYGENVYAYALYVFYGHAGFEVDWGPGDYGMQTPPGHRENIHNSAFREIGVGVVDGTNGTNDPVGPQLVTQDFGTQPANTPFISGVVYYDLAGSGFYNLGEGIGGVTVQVPGSTYFAITTTSGGYTVPVTTNGNYLVTFSANGLNYQVVATVSNLNNVEVDYVPTYSPPVISGPNPAALTNNNTYSFTAVAAATNYLYVISPLVPYTAVEGAENGSDYVTIVSSPGYSVFDSAVKETGNYSFHLCQPDGTPQSITLDPTFLASTNSQLIFAKLLGYATSYQVARAQVSTNGGSSWVDVWSEPGSDGSGDSGFSWITNSLSGYAGATIQVRFLYDITSTSSFYNETSDGVGLNLDDIIVTNVYQLQSPVTNSVPSGNSFVFDPTNAGSYLFSVSAQLPGRTLPAGPAYRVTAAVLPAMTIQFTGHPAISSGQFQANFNVVNYQSGTPFTLLETSSLGSGWTTDPSATFQTVVSNTQFKVTAPVITTNAYFRVQAN